MKRYSTMLAAALGLALLPRGVAEVIAARPRVPTPGRSRQRPKGWLFSGGTGELRKMRTEEESERRITAAQAKRERRRIRNLAVLQGRSA